MLLPCFTAGQKLKNLCIHPHFWGVFLFLIYSRAEPQSSRRVNLIMHYALSIIKEWRIERQLFKSLLPQTRPTLHLASECSESLLLLQE